MDDRCVVAAVCATSPAKADEAAAALAIPRAESDWRRLVEDPTIDAITLAVPPTAQVEIASAALHHGKAVFCEKPLAADLEAAAKLAADAKRLGLPNLVNFEFPEHAAWQQALQLMACGAIGRLRYVNVRWHVLTFANKMRRESWKTRSTDGGGTLGNFVTHTVDYLELFGGPMVRLRAQLDRAPDDARPGETLVRLWTEFASGAVGSVSVNTDAGPGNSHVIELIGDEGTIELANEQPDYLAGFGLRHGRRDGLQQLQQLIAPELKPQIDGRIVATARLMGKMIAWSLTGRPAEPSFERGLRAQQWLAAARRSAESGQAAEITSAS